MSQDLKAFILKYQECAVYRKQKKKKQSCDWRTVSAAADSPDGRTRTRWDQHLVDDCSDQVWTLSGLSLEARANCASQANNSWCGADRGLHANMLTSPCLPDPARSLFRTGSSVVMLVQFKPSRSEAGQRSVVMCLDRILGWPSFPPGTPQAARNHTWTGLHRRHGFYSTIPCLINL